MTTSTQAIAAARLYAADYAYDAGLLRCRHCGRRVEPSMSRIHLDTPRCRVVRGKATVKRLGLVRAQPYIANELDPAGLVRWLETSIDIRGNVVREAWVTPQLLRHAKNRSHAETDSAASRREYFTRLGELTPRELEVELSGVKQ